MMHIILVLISLFMGATLSRVFVAQGDSPAEQLDLFLTISVWTYLGLCFAWISRQIIELKTQLEELKNSQTSSQKSSDREITH